MTIRHLKIFIAVAETGKMSLAASKLYLSQPTVSQAIHELEEYYGVLLFERLSKRLYITEAGRRLLFAARKTLLSFDELSLQMQNESQGEHLRIGATITIGTCLLPRLLENLERQRPNTDTFSYIGNTETIEKMLLHAELDIGIAEGIVKSPELISIPVLRDYLVLACSAEHPLAQRTSFTSADLMNQDFVMREKGSGTRALFERFLLENNISIHCKIEAPFPEAMKNAILYNHCLAVISVRLIEKEIKEGTIHILHHPTSAWDRTFNLVYHKDKYITESIEFLKHLLTLCSEPVL